MVTKRAALWPTVSVAAAVWLAALSRSPSMARMALPHHTYHAPAYLL